ncbi:hypothetical protein ACLMJK_007530 [Lecanora helva]
MSAPTDAPPSYDEVTASGSGPSSRPSQSTNHLSVPHKERNGIPALNRRSMEDEGRDLPSGWVRQYDASNQHQFFVDTNVEPPRSIWHHPYDDDDFMNALEPAERQRIQNLHRVPNQADVAAESSDDDTDVGNSKGHTQQPGTAELPPRETQPTGATKFGRRLKDKITSSTHEQREAQRQRRAEEERKAYQRHMELRQAMSRAAQTGQPQFVGKGRDGKDVYIEPPQMGPAYGGGYGGGYGYNPYARGPYSTPQATYVRPQYPYARPYGRGYGGGLGLPIAGGLLGGLLLGDMMF